MVGEAVAAGVREDEMVQECDAEQFRALPKSTGEHTIFLARGGIAGRVVVRTCDVKSR